MLLFGWQDNFHETTLVKHLFHDTESESFSLMLLVLFVELKLRLNIEYPPPEIVVWHL